jgi:hypothetical protein
MTAERPPRFDVVHLTSVHLQDDTRIFLKEARTLASAGYSVAYVVPDGAPGFQEGVWIEPVAATQSRATRMTRLAREVWRQALHLHARLYHFHDLSCCHSARWPRYEGVPSSTTLTRTCPPPSCRSRGSRLRSDGRSAARPDFRVLASRRRGVREWSGMLDGSYSSAHDARAVGLPLEFCPMQRSPHKSVLIGNEEGWCHTSHGRATTVV